MDGICKLVVRLDHSTIRSHTRCVRFLLSLPAEITADNRSKAYPSVLSLSVKVRAAGWRCRFHIKWPLFSAQTLQNAPVLGENVAKKRPFNVKYAAVRLLFASSSADDGMQWLKIPLGGDPTAHVRNSICAGRQRTHTRKSRWWYVKWSCSGTRRGEEGRRPRGRRGGRTSEDVTLWRDWPLMDSQSRTVWTTFSGCELGAAGLGYHS